MTNNRRKATINSSLWAAYGDALGYLSELTDKVGLKKRIKTDTVINTVRSMRNIGGKFGVNVALPPGCYSDDTQLRLSTSRAIRGDGEFDIEAFAKVELPVWLSYALGAGKGTKVAASSFRKSDVNWFSNFYEEEGCSYINGGGNGAAMRIQPHVWAAINLEDPKQYMKDVIRNSISTHGHPRGFLGAVFHAWCVGYVIKQGSPPGPTEWKEAIYFFEHVPAIIKNDPDLATFWLPKWEQRSTYSIDEFCHEIKIECLGDIRILESYVNDKPSSAYGKMLHSIGALTDQYRGAGTKTAILSSCLAWLFRNSDPKDALLTASNSLKSDTDTIATMAGAIIGASTETEPNDEIMDREYIIKEASRMFEISQGNGTSSFHYPDLQKWVPPKTQLDAVRYSDEAFFLSGISKAIRLGEKYESKDSIWQWLDLQFGQSVLAKRRREILPIKNENIPIRPEVKKYVRRTSTDSIAIAQPSLFVESKQSLNEYSIEVLTNEVISSGFEAEVIGKNFLKLTEKASSIEEAIAYAAIIMKAINARKRRNVSQ